VTGTIINAAAILAGGVAGLTLARHLTPQRQVFLKVLLAGVTVYVGLTTTWQAVGGSFSQVARQLGIVLLALVLGNVAGAVLRLQKGLNRLGAYAQERFQRSDRNAPSRFSEGFITCTLLFCVGPLAILGSIQDGLSGNYRTLALKGVMDGLATMGFVAAFGPGVMLAALPVVAYQGTITLLAGAVEPWLAERALVDSINATGGLLVCTIAPVILDLKRVPLANYLPSLVIAPLLTKWWS
jgi:uncharacterized membrane protein YqgA involved in biofilm formation